MLCTLKEETDFFIEQKTTYLTVVDKNPTRTKTIATKVFHFSLGKCVCVPLSSCGISSFTAEPFLQINIQLSIN